MSFFKITPIDVLLFRDHKPFNNYDSLIATSYLTPNPTTIAGMFKWMVVNAIAERNNTNINNLIATQLSQNEIQLLNSVDFHQNNGENDQAQFSLENIFLIKDQKEIMDSIFIPTPNDLVYYKHKSGFEIKIDRFKIPLSCKPNLYKTRISWDKNHIIQIENVNQPLFLSKEGITEILSRKQPYISLNQVKQYMRGYIPKIHLDNFLYSYEHRSQIRIDNKSKKTEENSLFHVEYLRLKENISFLAELLADDAIIDMISNYYFVNLGGERKLASITQYPQERSKKITENIVSTQNEVIDFINTNNKQYFSLFFINFTCIKVFSQFLKFLEFAICDDPQKDNSKLKIFDIIYDKPRLIGGFDYKNKKMKPLQYVYPPGTVVYIKKEKNLHIKKPQKILKFSQDPLINEKNGYGSFLICKNYGE